MAEISDAKDFLRREKRNRILVEKGDKILQCLRGTFEYELFNRQHANNQSYHLITGDTIQNEVTQLLIQHNQVFKTGLSLLVAKIPESALPNKNTDPKETTKRMNHFYKFVTSKCQMVVIDPDYIELYLYAVATCQNTPIYILRRNEIGQMQWVHFQPLFEYEGQPVCVIPYISMYMSSQNIFHRIESKDCNADRPITTGLVGMCWALLEDTSDTIGLHVPDELLHLSKMSRGRLCDNTNFDVVVECCDLFKAQKLITLADHTRMTASRNQFRNVVVSYEDTYKVFCQVLIKRREKILLEPFVDNWETFVESSSYLCAYDALVSLENATHNRNASVLALVSSCQDGSKEIDGRRKNVTTAVIASSSVGLVSGGMVIAGILLAPVSFGASLGISIAGGVIGVGTGVAAGSARGIEAVKQNETIKVIENINVQELVKEEENFAVRLTKFQEIFQRKILHAQERGGESLGISLHGFLAIGSAIRVGHGVAGIALAAARVSVTAATAAASVLGPISMVVDVAFLVEAAHNKRKGDKTNAGEKLQTLSKSVQLKHRILNNKLRGNAAVDERLFFWN